MKMRSGWVSNSSSTSYVVQNVGWKDITLVDFVIAIGARMVKDFVEQYEWHNYTFDQLLASAQARFNDAPEKYTLSPEEKAFWVFGDEHGDVIGNVFDYMLRDGGDFDQNDVCFRWYLDEYLR